MSYRLSRLLMLAVMIVVSNTGCRQTRPTPEVYPPIGFTPTPTSGVADEWVCPMHRTFKTPQPGKCSVCGMDLVHSSELPPAEKPSAESGHSHSSRSGRFRSSGLGGGCH